MESYFISKNKNPITHNLKLFHHSLPLFALVEDLGDLFDYKPVFSYRITAIKGKTITCFN